MVIEAERAASTDPILGGVLRGAQDSKGDKENIRGILRPQAPTATTNIKWLTYSSGYRFLPK